MTDDKTTATTMSTALVLYLATLPARAWLLMLVVGALHGLTADVPAIGYGTMLLLTTGADYVTNTARQIVRK